MDPHTDTIIQATKALLKSFGYFVDNLWHADDVHFICEQQNLPKISDAEAMEVFTIAGEQFDGETGISWPQLEAALRVYLKKKALLAEPRENMAESA
ncbi:MAG: hypothetical protein KGI29_09005 [Pseudomonadota bacterium]|nr:hypothetical protein [Pseudomonadota bacterium]MDE3038456.1 hypothetical protein [Pseudomonadota bacterium]